MPPKGVSKAVSKRCPECKKQYRVGLKGSSLFSYLGFGFSQEGRKENNLQIPVATRHCHCGHQFFEERRRSTTSNTSEQDETEDSSGNAAGYDVKGRGLYLHEGASSQVASSSSPASEGKRRSERVKREKPNFYDSLEYDNQMRKARKERQKEEQLQQQTTGRIKRERKMKPCSEPEDDEDEEPPKEKRKRKKKRSSNGDKKEEEVEEDLMAGILPEKEWQFSMILSDINMKLGLNNPKFCSF